MEDYFICSYYRYNIYCISKLSLQSNYGVDVDICTNSSITAQYQTVDPHRGQQFSTSSDLPGRQVFAEDNSSAIIWSSDGQVSSKYNDHPPKRVVNTLVLDGTIYTYWNNYILLRYVF
jgi:hypothetical protein